jgi:hypothetical protein
MTGRGGAARTSRPDRPVRDDGSILPLVVACGALSLAVILVVTAATSLYLERKRLFTVADAAALAGAEAFDLDAVSVTGQSLTVDLRDGDVRSAVRDYLIQRTDRRTAPVRLETAEASGGTARVTLSTRWRPPVLTPLVPDGLRIEVTTTARAVFR